MRTLSTYTLTDLYDLQAQGSALLPTLASADAARMTDLLAALAGEIADRRGQESLSALVCGYDDDGAVLDTPQAHRFARVRGRCG